MIIAENISVYLRKPLDGMFVLGSSKLDQGLLGDGTDTELIAVHDQATDIDMDYGNTQFTSVNSEPRAGTCTLRFRGETLDPTKADWLKPSTPMQVEANGNRLFTGWVRNIGVLYPKGEEPYVTLTCEDVVHILANKVYEADLPAENAYTRLQRFSAWNVVPMRKETSPGVYQDMVNLTALKGGHTYLEVILWALEAEGGIASVDAQGYLRCYANGYFSAATDNATFTDIPADINPASGVVSYTEIGAGYSTTALCNVLTITNKDVSVGEEVDTVYGPYINASSQELWGPAKVDLTMTYSGGTGTSPRTGSIPTIAAAIIADDANSTPKVRIDSITFEPKATDADQIALAQELTTLSKVMVKYHTETNTIEKSHFIVGVKHNITATRWKATYALMQVEELI